MLVEIEGDVLENGMVMDYYHLKDSIEPLVEKMDHAFLVHKDDKVVIEFLEKMNSKKVVVDFHSTVENITRFFLNEIKKANLPSNIHKVKIRVRETPDDYAEEEISL